MTPEDIRRAYDDLPAPTKEERERPELFLEHHKERLQQLIGEEIHLESPLKKLLRTL